MINREQKQLQVLTYSTSYDDYGQKRTDTPAETDITGTLHIISQQEAQNPKYIDIDAILITKVNTITVENEIKDGNTIYSIKHILPAYSNIGYTQYLLGNKK